MENKRRDFLKKTAVGAGALAVGSSVSKARTYGDSNNIPDGDKATYSSKEDIMYTKTENWSKFYKAATYNRIEV